MSGEVEVSPRATQMERHLQTLIVFVLTGLLVWVGTTVQQTQVAVAKLSVELAFMKEQLTDKDDKMVTIERRLDAIERELSRLSSNN